MEKLLRIVEQPPASEEVVIDGEKLRFFNSKSKIWNYAKISSSDYQKLSLEDRPSILKGHYVDMSAKCSLGSGTIIIFCFPIDFSSVFAILKCFFHVWKIVWIFF